MLLLRATVRRLLRRRVGGRPIRLLLLLTVSTALAAVACTSATSIVIPGTDPLVTVRVHGGLCAAGPCDTTLFLQRDGHVRTAAKPPNEVGVVGPAPMAALTAAINSTDFAGMQAKKFPGECPVAFDGQELIFEFAVPGGTRRVASCEVDIDWGDPLFVAVGAAMGEWVPLPET